MANPLIDELELISISQFANGRFPVAIRNDNGEWKWYASTGDITKAATFVRQFTYVPAAQVTNPIPDRMNPNEYRLDFGESQPFDGLTIAFLSKTTNSGPPFLSLDGINYAPLRNLEGNNILSGEIIEGRQINATWDAQRGMWRANVQPVKHNLVNVASNKVSINPERNNPDDYDISIEGITTPYQGLALSFRTKRQNTSNIFLSLDNQHYPPLRNFEGQPFRPGELIENQLIFAVYDELAGYWIASYEKQQLATSIKDGLISSNLFQKLNSSARVRFSNNSVFDSSNNSYNVNFSNPSITSLEEGDMFVFTTDVANTGHVNVNIDNLGLITLRKANGEQFESGDIEAGMTLLVIYERSLTQFRTILGSGGNGDSIYILDAREGLPELPAVTEANKPQWLKSFAFGTEGRIYVIEVIHQAGSDATGTWVETPVSGNFLGARGTAPSNPSAGQYYYDTSESHWILYVNLPIDGLTGVKDSLTDILGANAIWVGEHANQYQALHAIKNHNNNNTYYAEFGGRVYTLNNTSYSPRTSGTERYEWTSSVANLAKRVAILEDAGVGTGGTNLSFVTSIPSDSTGTNGNVAYNTDTGAVYRKTGGAWVEAVNYVTQAEFTAQNQTDAAARNELSIRILLLESAISRTPTTAEVLGDEIARTATLPTAAQTDDFTEAWTLADSVPEGVTTEGGILRIPDQRPDSNVIGFWVVGNEGDVGGPETFLPFGARNADLGGSARSYNAVPVKFDNGEVIMATYYHDDTDGDSIKLTGIGKALPANANVRVYLAVSASGTGSSGGQSSPGVSFITPNLIHLTQWRYSATMPAVPSDSTYHAESGTFGSFPSAGWFPNIPTSGSSNPLWVATALILRDTAGTWHPASWTIHNVNSVTIQFYNVTTQAWEASPNVNTSDIRLWQTGVGWRTISVKSRHTILAHTAVIENTDKVNVANVRITDIDKLGFEIIRGNNRWYCEIPMYVVASDGVDLPVDGTLTPAQERGRHNSTITIKFGEDGYASAFITRANSGAVYHNSAFNGGVFLNLQKNAADELVTAKFDWVFGIALSGNPTVRIMAVT